MFLYFPTNYVWSMNVVGGVESGGKLGEIDDICRPLLKIAEQGDDSGTEAFFRAWKGGADRLIDLAEEDEANGHKLSAGDKLGRAALYTSLAERMQAHGFEERLSLYKYSLELFQRGITLARENCTRVEIPYAGTHLAGLFAEAGDLRDGRKAPCIVVMNGLDSTKEMLFRSGMAKEFTRRGISALFIDQPGTGEALRLQGLPAIVESERWAGAVIDYLATRDDIDAGRIGALGVSLGGYYAPRAVAFEKRFALGAVWGANHNWGEIQKRRLENQGENPVPHYWKHVHWVWGAKDQDDFMKIAERVNLDGIAELITVPFLVTHGEKDRQIPLEYAYRTYDQLTASPKRELKIFTDREGGVEHSSIDNPAYGASFISDWIADRFEVTARDGVHL